MNHIGTPTLILYNGDIRTQDAHRPVAEAVAITQQRVVATGDNRAIKALGGPDTDMVNLGGRLVLPGLMDAHFHYYDWALGRRELALADVASFDELLDRVSTAAEWIPPGDWIVGQGWNESDWPERRLPRRVDLDAVAPQHPVILWRCDLHLASVNSAALERAGITEDASALPEDLFGRNASGRLDGILRETAPNRVKAVIPAPSPETVEQWMYESIAVLHSMGLTGINDVRIPGAVDWLAAFSAWQRIREAGKLDLRCRISLPSEYLDTAIQLGLRSGFGDDRLGFGHVKFFADGGMGARTAWMIEPYRDAEYGLPIGSMATLAADIRRADDAGLAVMVHAIGDRANREVTDIFEQIEADPDRSCRPMIRHRIEHAQVIRPEDLARLARLAVDVCVQPHNLVLDINMIDESVGDRGRWAYVFADMLAAGKRVLFSSDCPVCSPNPLVGIHAAVTRQRENGQPEGGWYPQQKVPVEAAVRAYTTTPYAAYGLDDRLGSIRPGQLADIIALDRNLFDIDPAEIPQTRIDLTIFDGRIVHRMF
jgi:predicted amidohydrolase YtcJ